VAGERGKKQVNVARHGPERIFVNAIRPVTTELKRDATEPARHHEAVSVSGKLYRMARQHQAGLEVENGQCVVEIPGAIERAGVAVKRMEDAVLDVAGHETRLRQESARKRRRRTSMLGSRLS
jgi:hypothetical protein